jgi:hypothetical protein
MRDFEINTTLNNMLKGVNPVTKEKLSSEDVIMHPTVRKALKRAICVLDRTTRKLYSQWNPLNAGKRWSEIEDSCLKQAYITGISLNVLARIHQRREDAIRSRLNYLGIKSLSWQTVGIVDGTEVYELQ